MRRLADHVSHWRTLLAYAGSAHVPADALRESLRALDEAMAPGKVRAMRHAHETVRHDGLALERTLRRRATPPPARP
jgi:hypothetical protein